MEEACESYNLKIKVTAYTISETTAY